MKIFLALFLMTLPIVIPPKKERVSIGTCLIEARDSEGKPTRLVCAMKSETKTETYYRAFEYKP